MGITSPEIRSNSFFLFFNNFDISKFAPFVHAGNILEIEKNNSYQIADGIRIELADVEISSADIPGFSVATNNGITVALDITLSKALKKEGLAREFVNRIQILRKEKGFEVLQHDCIRIIFYNSIVTIKYSKIQ